jgi:sterol desaturase/sphingolipid hydroxylase (fatty acid hydroxylase superfamily)
MSAPILSTAIIAIETEAASNVQVELKPRSLVARKLALREQLAAQRQVIAFKLMPKRALSHSGETRTQYRSFTMRFLTQNPASAFKLALGLATLLIGARASGVFNTGLQVYKMAQLFAKSR